MGEDVHANHRKRMIEKFMKHGLGPFDDHEVLEILLFFVIPRADTNPIAHRLLDRFNTLHGVLEAPVQQLKEVKGIGDRSATLIKFMCALTGRYESSRVETNDRLVNFSLIANYFIPKFIGKTNEVLLAAFLDGTGKVICCEELGQGSNTSVAINYGAILRYAVINNAAAVILAHNHPDGLLKASNDDIYQTDNLSRLLKQADITLAAHCIVSGTSACFVHQNFKIYKLGD